jgi:hypothetical protein
MIKIKVEKSVVFSVTGVRGFLYKNFKIFETYRNDLGEKFINVNDQWFLIDEGAKK